MAAVPTVVSPIDNIGLKHQTHGAGTIFRLGEQNLNDLSVGEAKTDEKQSRQSNSKYNFMQYVFLEKGICSVQWV